MINLIRFIIRNSGFFLFLLCEMIAFYLIIEYNQGQKTLFVNSTQNIVGTLTAKYDQLRDYTHLTEINKQLNTENARLLQKIEFLKLNQHDQAPDSLQFHPAKIISNSISGRYNRLLLNRGRADGLTQGMGILYQGVPVGQLFDVSEHYASALSILHVDVHFSVSIKNKSYFGMLTWLPPDPRHARIDGIPAYADIQPGDTVVTSGYSLIFPPGLPMATVRSLKKPKGSHLATVDVDLLIDPMDMDYVQVIENQSAQELDSLINEEAYGK